MIFGFPKWIISILNRFPDRFGKEKGFHEVLYESVAPPNLQDIGIDSNTLNCSLILVLKTSISFPNLVGLARKN